MAGGWPSPCPFSFVRKWQWGVSRFWERMGCDTRLVLAKGPAKIRSLLLGSQFHAARRKGDVVCLAGICGGELHGKSLIARGVCEDGLLSCRAMTLAEPLETPHKWLLHAPPCAASGQPDQPTHSCSAVIVLLCIFIYLVCVYIHV